MISDSFQAAELSAPPPRWAVVVSLVLIVVITATIIAVVPTQPGGDLPAAPAVASIESR